MGKPRALVVDDELSICKGSEKILAREGYEVKYALSGREALSLLAQEPFDLLFTDLKMAEMSGMELLETLRIRYPDIVPVVITGYATVPSVVESMKLGAYDFLPKPFEVEELAFRLERALRHRNLLEEVKRLRESQTDPAGDELVGDSAAMRKLRQLVARVARSDAPVLITGETGSGKELVARAIHRQGARPGR